MPPPLAQSPGETRIVPLREPSLLGDLGIQLRFQLLESGLEPILLPQGQGLPQKPSQLPREAHRRKAEMNYPLSIVIPPSLAELTYGKT
jgi:hypothetical protein